MNSPCKTSKLLTSVLLDIGIDCFPSLFSNKYLSIKGIEKNSREIISVNMKRNYRKAVNRVPKKNTRSTYSPYYTRPYSHQHNQNISGVSYHSSHSIASSGPKTPNGHFYNSNNGRPMHSSIPDFVQQTSLQYYQNKESHNTYQKSLTVPRDASQLSIPHMQNCELVQSHSPKRKWSREDAIKAIQVEEEFCKQNTNCPCLIIRFPDPPLNPEIVKEFSREIDMVHFQNNSSPRYCFVRLKGNADTAKVIHDISKIPFGVGYLSAEIRADSSRGPNTKPELVDPYTLYVGNLSLSVTVETIKQHFPGALRYDLAFRSKQKPKRYAFIHFENLEKAIEAFKEGLHLQIDGRTIVLRFRRVKLNIPSESLNSIENDKNHDDSNMVTVSANENIIENNRNTSFSIKIHTNNQSSLPVIDLTEENVIANNNTNCLPYTASNSEMVIKTEEPDEDKNTSNSMLHIKDELYDSEDSYEDDCGSSYLGECLINLESNNIKTEIGEEEQTPNSNFTRTMTFENNANCDYEENSEQSRLYSFNATALVKNGPTNGTNPESVAKGIHFGVVQDRNRTNVKDNFRAVETNNPISSTTSLSEEKYIENLYDQLNSAKVFKKEKRSEFDELEEMLREFD